jgi:hypothetical protein
VLGVGLSDAKRLDKMIKALITKSSPPPFFIPEFDTLFGEFFFRIFIQLYILLVDKKREREREGEMS